MTEATMDSGITEKPKGVRAMRFGGTWMTDPELIIDVEPSPKRVRVEFGGETIADSEAVLILREGKLVPVYYFPRGDVRMDLLTRTDHSTHCPHKADASYWTIAAGGRTEENAVWSYEAPLPHMAAIKDYLAFYWNKMDRWLEEDEEVFVHAMDPRKRIDIRASSRRVEVVVGGVTIADSTNGQFLFETDLPTRYYLPQADVRMDLLTPTASRTACPYKGEASYWAAEIDGARIEDIVWSYADPVEGSERLRGLMCFYNENVDEIRVGGMTVPKPQTKWSK
jgi:uncharacterized protein (DUF427 family)